MAGRKDGQTLLDRLLLATAGDVKTTIVVEWHLKNIGYDVVLTKNYYVTVSMQKIAQFINSFLRYSRF